MKVLLITNQLEVGGIETNLIRLVEALSRRGHRCTVAAHPGSLSWEIAHAGGRLVSLGMRSSSLISDIVKLRQEIASERPDVVHVFSATTALVAWAPVRTVWRRPGVLASVMGLYDRPDEPARTVAVRTRLAVLGADRVVVMSPAIGEVVRRVGVRRRRIIEDTIVGVPAATRPDARHCGKVRDSLGIRPDVSIVSTIGRLEPRKSPLLFVDAAARVLKTQPDTVFLMVGDGSLENEVRARIAELGIVDAMRLVGSRRDVNDLLAVTDVYVRPAVVEGFIGITVLEAQALGVPVVSFDTQDVRLAIDHEATGLLAANSDSIDLAAQIERLLRDKHLASRIGEAGRRRFLQNYELEHVVDRLTDTYSRLRRAPRAAVG